VLRFENRLVRKRRSHGRRSSGAMGCTMNTTHRISCALDESLTAGMRDASCHLKILSLGNMLSISSLMFLSFRAWFSRAGVAADRCVRPPRPSRRPTNQDNVPSPFRLESFRGLQFYEVTIDSLQRMFC
jgi:hypothetical protein